ncbi:hypothetical protein FACS1894111_05840 [Clostridia bacterium]|nr:hypothetical protein FACS1894111_05840 [Clostridia bacterium]
MARAKNPDREKAKKQWIESGGKVTIKELATAYSVPEQRIRKWKSIDKWQQDLTEPKPVQQTKERGGQKGNQNAAGGGAPKGNSNAETHGAYARVHLESLTTEERAYIEGLTLESEANMLRELQLLFAKERDLTRKIKEYESADPNTLYIDRVVEMFAPKGKEGNGESGNNRSKEELKTTMRTVIKASPFERAMKLEAEYNKNHGRILKLIDSMRAYEVDKKRIDLDERKHTLTKQRLSGEYNIDPETGAINDTEQADGAEDTEE